MKMVHHIESNYRADIDGLRAIAVLMVVLNHLRFPHFFGGFVGVDVFFVISGYLIGASLIAEFRANSFSLGAFYERRVRRILPALLAMLAVVCILAYRYLAPFAMTKFAGSLTAALFSYSNVLFWTQSGYFDAPSAAKPLLHTWSLAVEEQFYVFFPLLLFLIFRWAPKRLLAILWATAVLSLGLSVWTMRFGSSSAFFWSPLRAWELIAGVIASQHTFPALTRPITRELVAFVGLAFILYSGMTYKATTPFPGWAALVPCLGTVAIITAGAAGASLVGRMLSVRPMTFFGLISYSLYLWHWPVLVFQNSGMMISSRPSIERNTKLAILVLSIILATLSWRFIETPFRKRHFGSGRAALFVPVGVVAGLILFFSVTALRAHGLPSRFSDEVVRVTNFENYDPSSSWRQGSCFLVPPNTFDDFKPNDCLDVVANRKSYLLLGDSTAAQLYPGLKEAFPDIHFQQATTAGCNPYEFPSEEVSQYGLFAVNCRAMWTYIDHVFLVAKRPDAIILAARWDESSLNRLQSEIAGFEKDGIPVILYGPGIAFDMPVPVLLSAEMRRHDARGEHAKDLSAHLDPGGEQLDLRMAEAARHQWHVSYISYFADLCGQQVEMEAKTEWETANGCPMFTGPGEPLIFDEHHLTIAASLLFANIVRDRGQLRE